MTLVLPEEDTIILDKQASVAESLRKARVWAGCPHRPYVDCFIHEAKAAGDVPADVSWKIYETLQRAEDKAKREGK